jgi:N-acetyl-alpha-D-muramate 1-phosphate uridylyltransferase
VKAIILAAGRGERMRPLTDHTPKPLLAVHGKPLIEWHIEALARAGVREIVVNTAWLEDRFVAVLGDGARFGVALRYSMEGRDFGGALETAGGIANALPMLIDHESDPFWVVSGDIHVPAFAFDTPAVRHFTEGTALGHLWLVPNPPFHPGGDFGFAAGSAADAPFEPAAATLTQGAGADGLSFTYANLALCRAGLVAGVAAGARAALGPLLFEAARRSRLTGEVYGGAWENVGTPAQLEALNDRPHRGL